MDIDALRVKPDRCTRRRIVVARAASIIGIDVGEDFLDLASLPGDRAILSYHRIPLADVTRTVADSLACRIAGAIGGDLRSAIGLVDSPRTPRDIDCSGAKMIARANPPTTRSIDATLRALLYARFNG
ncbi:MAG TPA: hypothetical protein VKV03_18060, partial [Candidatus Binataceae bacterium]|nr:hypothetical protein [Candidatus Binataceae bacterium]